MNTKSRLPVFIGAGIGAVTLIGGLALFKPWLLWTNVTVNEAIPMAVTSVTSRATVAPSEAVAQVSTSPSTAPVQATQQGPKLIAQGNFISHEHTTSGKASIFKLENGKYQLAFEGLKTSNGPDVHVWVSAGPVVEGLAGFKSAKDHEKIDLGLIKGNQGNQVYDLPENFDPTKWKSIDLWCDQFSVSFGAAPITPV